MFLFRKNNLLDKGASLVVKNRKCAGFLYRFANFKSYFCCMLYFAGFLCNLVSLNLLTPFDFTSRFRIKAVNTPGLILQIWAKVSYDFTTQDFSKLYDPWLASLHLTMIENGHKLASF